MCAFVRCRPRFRCHVIKVFGEREGVAVRIFYGEYPVTPELSLRLVDHRDSFCFHFGEERIELLRPVHADVKLNADAEFILRQIFLCLRRSNVRKRR